VDSGTYTYTADTYLRNEFRRTKSHNTLIVDNTELADVAGLWKIRADETRPRVLNWVTGAERDVLEAEHSGYLALPSGIIHRRRFDFLKSPFLLTIKDQLKGSGSHLLEGFLHFAPTVSVELAGPQKAIARIENARYIVTISRGELLLAETWYSRSYGVRERNQTLKLGLNAIIPIEIETTVRKESSV
jgi:hypothetical protein